MSHSRSPVLQRRCRSLALLCLLPLLCAPAAAAAPSPPSPLPDPLRYPAPTAPVSPLRVTRGFDAPAQRWKPGHRGVDLAAEAGARVVSPHAGRILHVGTVAGRPTVSIDAGAGWRSTLEPVATTLRKGEDVEAGTPLGTVASGGHCAETCVHWGLRHGSGRDSAYRDPLSLLRRPEPSVLWIDESTPPR